jgi:HD-GYP domain-containing protein (c-di-GMP phosphodiesterase class II)
MLIVPMLDHLDRVVGVLQLLNRKSERSARITSKAAADRYVLPYSGREMRLARSLASQAAISIENAKLYAQIEHIFERFIEASVTAIEQRDPTTAGHSLRVATLTEELAKAAELDGRGSLLGFHLTGTELRELRYAALLHDFGKISVPEDVLIKAKKLPPVLWERVNGRFDLIRCTTEVEYLKKRAAIEVQDRDATARLDDEYANEIAELERLRKIVREANEPHVVAQAAIEELSDIARRTFEARDGKTVPFLTTEELHYLQLARGTLDPRERAEVEAHVVETFRFLDQIPWTDELKNLAAYAYGHHEKLNGTGYPRQLRADEIPIQTRMITLADMFDALTAADRPYKPVVAPDRALEIIREEADAGLLDSDLVRVMVERQVYRKVLHDKWHF